MCLKGKNRCRGHFVTTTLFKMIFVVFFVFCLAPFFAVSKIDVLREEVQEHEEAENMDEKMVCHFCLEESKNAISSFRRLSSDEINQSIYAGCEVFSSSLQDLCSAGMRKAYEKVLLVQPEQLCSGFGLCPAKHGNCEACKTIYQHVSMKTQSMRRVSKPRG